MATDKEIVRQLLREAFPSTSEREDLRPLSHDEAVYMRSRLALLKNEDLPFYLYQILEDLLDTHTGNVGESEDVEAVVQYLDVLIEGVDLKAICDQLGTEAFERIVSEGKYLRPLQTAAFALFTRSQAFAISEWLELAKGWADLKWYQGYIEAALSYWRKRASQGKGISPVI